MEPVDNKVEVDSDSTERQPEIQPPQNTDIENPVSGSKQLLTEPPPNQNKRGSFLTCYMPIPKPLYYLIYCLLFVCFTPVAYALLTAVTVAILPLLLGALVVARLVQFLVKDADIQKYSKFKVLLRYWVFMVLVLFLVEVGLFYPIAKYVPGLKLVMIVGLPITKWIKIICSLIGIYLVNQVIWVSMIAILVQVIPDEDNEKRHIILESISEIIGCLLFLWAEVVVMSSVPTFEQSKIFGICTRKWIKVSLFLLIGYNIITLLAHTFVWFLPKVFGDQPGIGDALSWFCCDELGNSAFNKKYVVYAIGGTKRSVIFISSMMMLLLTWVLYFGNHLNTTPEDKRVLEFGTWTLVSLLISSFLWLIKSCILLYWESRSVYDRLNIKITAIGKQLYFLVLLSYTNWVYPICFPVNDSAGCGLSCSKTLPEKKGEGGSLQWVLLEAGDDGDLYINLNRRRVRADLINHKGSKASTYEIQKAAQLFLTAQYPLSKEDIIHLKHLQGNGSEENNDENCIKTLMKIVQVEGDSDFDDDWKMLLKLLPDVETKEEITVEKVKKFMERARSSCMFLSNTFISEKEVAECLNQVMSGIIIGAIFIMWLLVTGLASTKILVIIASPVLAATFIFGDTAKGLFQGLIFVYVVHPYDVGDLCLIDGELLEVVRISIWCTTFSYIRTIGEQQQVIYPNSVLALKNVVNHRSNFNWNDQVELLCTPDKRITEPLLQKIETYLKEQKEKFTPNFHSVEIREIGDKAKIVVHVKHKLPTTEGWTYFECLKAKEKRRYELAIYVHDLTRQLESGSETPESAKMEEFLTSG